MINKAAETGTTTAKEHITIDSLSEHVNGSRWRVLHQCVPSPGLQHMSTVHLDRRWGHVGSREERSDAVSAGPEWLYWARHLGILWQWIDSNESIAVKRESFGGGLANIFKVYRDDRGLSQAEMQENSRSWHYVGAELANGHPRDNEKSNYERNSLGNPDPDHREAEFQRVFVRRLALLVVNLPLAFLFAGLALLCFESGSVALSLLCLSGSAVCGFGGWFLWAAMYFGDTWDWWL
ncbi:MAG TPA: hypothetical protein VHY79_18275 [Rhizomicrobium sp.]|jgi:hypothetical protein|nr:hypothetical protein [Rhizomicrobium sp.]